MSVDNTSRNHFVYRMFDQHGQLLYVGCTMRPQQRWREHRGERTHMTDRVSKLQMWGPYTRPVAREIEKKALATEFPMFGSTPQRKRIKAKRNRWVNQETVRLYQAGVDINRAVHIACDRVDDEVPDPHPEPRNPDYRRHPGEPRRTPAA